MDHIEFLEQPNLHSPPVIFAFRGWNDGGEAASLAARFLVEQWEAKLIARLDPEEFYDFQVTRPMVRLEDGVSRALDWPWGEFMAATVGEKDVVVYRGAEPNVRWRTFTAGMIETAQAMGCSMLVTLGGFLTDVPHTRPVPVVGSAIDRETAERLGVAQSQYEGPTGIVGVLHDASSRSGIPSVSLWAAVPHYLHHAANPKAARALVEHVTSLLDLPVDTSPLREEEASWIRETNGFVADNEELAEYVARLESAADQNQSLQRMADQPMPSGDAIAAELERFLREQGGA